MSIPSAEMKKGVHHIIRRFDYEKQELDEQALSRLKNLIRSNANLIPEFEQNLITSLKANDSDKRLCIVLLADYFFQRSHDFRTALLNDLQEFLTYTLELDPLYYPLPGPVKAATSLKKEALRIFKLWDEKFAAGYQKLSRTKTMLLKSKKFNFDRVDGLTAIERTRQDAESARQTIINGRVQDEVYKGFNDSKAHIEQELTEAKSTLNLLFPDFRNDGQASSSNSTSRVQDLPERVAVFMSNGVAIEKTEDNVEILRTMSDSKKLLQSNLNKVTGWIKRLTKHGSTAAVMDNLLKLQREMTNELRRCKEIKVVETRKAVLTAARPADDEDFSDDDDDDDEGFESVDLSLEDPEGLGTELGNDETKVESKIEKKPVIPVQIQSPIGRNPLVKRPIAVDEIDADAPGPSKKAPVLPYGLDLLYWGEDVTPAELPKNRGEGHSFWRPQDDDTVNRESEDVYKTRVMTYVGEMPKIKKSCRHPLPSGMLCPRMDRKTCPLHGVIIDRDEEGNPVDISAAGQYKRAQDEFMKKKKDAEEDAYFKDLEVQTGGKFSYDLAMKAKKKKNQREGKKRQKSPGEALRDRLKTKLLDRRTMRRVADTLDSIQQAKTQQKFAHQWNY